MNSDCINLVRHVRHTLARYLGIDLEAVTESQANPLQSNQRALPICASMIFIGALGAVVAFAAPRNAVAQSGPSQIPERAFAACESKAEGDACSVYFGEHELKGTCVKEPSGSRLLCRPDTVPPPPR